jgi:hypothetical protein
MRMHVAQSLVAGSLATLVVLFGSTVGCGSSGGGGGDGGAGAGSATSGPTGSGAGVGGSTTGGTKNPTCKMGTSAGAVQAPMFVKNLPGETSWFASPVLADLDHDGKRELVAAYYSLYVFGSDMKQLAKVSDGMGRVYAPHVVADLEGDGVMDIVAGNDSQVLAYEWKNGALSKKAGWPADTTSANNPPEVRGLAAGDLDGDGKLEIVATTTQTAPTADGGAQVFVFSANGQLFQPSGINWQAWPRYNAKTGQGNDADRNGAGHDGYGCYGLNVAIGNIDDDPALEVLVTYDNHHIQAFDYDGVAIDASSYFTNPDSQFLGQRLTWGQFIRWADATVEENHYHLHQGEYPNPTTQEWLQWTASPPNVVDIDGDGKNEVLGVPNVEFHDPYVTQAYAIMVLEGSHGDGSRSAMRKAGWEVLPRGDAPITVAGDYPPIGVPAPVTVNIQGDAKPEVLVSLGDGKTYLFDATGKEIWRFNHTSGKPVMFASEPTVADLNQDGSPEILLTTFGDPDTTDSGHLFVLAADGTQLFDVPLPGAGHNGNGNGAPAAPTVGDLDGDGQVEIFVQTFDHGMDVFTVPGSAENCLLWATGRGGPLRMGQPNGQ